MVLTRTAGESLSSISFTDLGICSCFSHIFSLLSSTAVAQGLLPPLKSVIPELLSLLVLDTALSILEPASLGHQGSFWQLHRSHPCSPLDYHSLVLQIQYKGIRAAFWYFKASHFRGYINRNVQVCDWYLCMLINDWEGLTEPRFGSEIFVKNGHCSITHCKAEVSNISFPNITNIIKIHCDNTIK